MRLNEVEEIIRLIHNGFDLELLSFELDMPIRQLEIYKEQLDLRRFVNDSIKNGKTQEALDKLNSFINNTENNLVERLMLLKLNAYIDKTNVNPEDLQEIEEERKRLGFSKNIDEVLDELRVQIHKRKSSNIKKKDKQNSNVKNKIITQEIIEEQAQEAEEIIELDYEGMINKYKEEISQKPEKSLNKRNLLAYTYFKAGRIDEARDQLFELIEQCGSYIAYRQLIHLEKSEGNFEDAKLWAYDAIDKFPNNVEIREQLISIAREEKDDKEVIKQLKEIVNIDIGSAKNEQRLKIINREER